MIAYDPKAIDNFKKLTKKHIAYAATAKEALMGADICIIQSDWSAFKSLTAEDFKELMKKPMVIDGRRTFDPEQLIENGVTYLGIGWKNRW